jgi:hypothetical protein
VPSFQTFFGTASEGVIENQCCQVPRKLGRKFSWKIGNIFAKIGVFRFRENFCEKYTRFSRNFLRKQKIFVKILLLSQQFLFFHANFLKKCSFSQKILLKIYKIFAKIFSKNKWDFHRHFDGQKFSRPFSFQKLPHLRKVAVTTATWQHCWELTQLSSRQIEHALKKSVQC